MSNKEVETERDTIQFKKDKLLCHVPFIEGMIAKTRGTEYESKWQTMLKCIVSDRKKMTIAQIYKLDSMIKNRQKENVEKSNCNDNVKQLKQLAKPLPKEFKSKVPKLDCFLKPANLGKPVLSSSDLQELIKDLGPEETPDISVKVDVELKKESTLGKSALIEVPLEKSPRARLPSSYIPSKATLPVERKIVSKPVIERVLLSPSLALPTLAGQLKVPKNSLNPSSSSTDLYKFSPNSAPIFRKLTRSSESLGVFDRIKDKHEKNRILNLKSSLLANNITSNIKRKLEKKSEVSTSTKLVVESASSEPSSDMSMKNPKEIKSTSSESSILIEQETKTVEEIPDVNIEQPLTSHEKDNEFEARRIQKELKRLHENIVKDAVPLSRKRSCTLKRSIGLRVSPNTTEESPAEDQIQEIINARRSTRRSIPDITEKSKEKSNKESPSTSAAKRTSPSAKELEAPEKSPPKRTTRQSVQIALEPAEEDDIVSPPSKKVRTGSIEQQGLEKIIENFDLKPCAIKLPSVSANDLKKLPVTQKQTARKSTAQRSPERILNINEPSSSSLQNDLKTNEPLSSLQDDTKIETRSMPTTDSNDDEWEDVDESASNEAQSEKTSSSDQATSKKSESSELEKCRTYGYKFVSNIGYAHSRDGAVFKCREGLCQYQVNNKHFFVKHLEFHHRDSKWNGYCMLCKKDVVSKVGLLMTEFIHMMSVHVLKEKHDDPELVKGIDTILEVLLQTESVEPANAHKLTPVVHTPSFRLTTIIPTQSAEKAPARMKMISKNIVGKVIKLPPGLLKGAKLLKTGASPVLSNKGSEVSSLQDLTASHHQVPSSSEILLPPLENTMKCVIQEPIPRSSNNPTLRVVTTKKVGEVVPAEKTQMFCSLATHPESSKNILVTNEPPETSENSCENLIVTKKMLQQDKGEMRYQEILRPWLGLRTNKNQASMKILMSPFALTATFKCLGASCCYFTTDPEIFRAHLFIHNKLTPNDRLNFLSCAYCKFDTSEDPKDLVNHIRTEHEYDIFQCQYCFYRSCADFNVLSHQNSFHKLKPRSILKIEAIAKRDYYIELQLAKKRRLSTVHPIICFYCKSTFYVFKAFFNHLKSHVDTASAKCTKCGMQATKEKLFKHIMECHGYGLYQCIYCHFGTNTFEIITAHIADEHPSKMPMFCERSENHNLDLRGGVQKPWSIESTILKHINLNVSAMVLKHAPKDKVLLKNELNMDRLLCSTSSDSKLIKTYSARNSKNSTDSLEGIKKILAQRDARKLANVAGDKFQRPSYHGNLVATSPPKVQVAQSNMFRKPTPIMPNPSGLQIQNVFSLSAYNSHISFSQNELTLSEKISNDVE